MSEIAELQENVTSLKQQLSFSSDKARKSEDSVCRKCLADLSKENGDLSEKFVLSKESSGGNLSPSTLGSPCMILSEREESDTDSAIKAQVLMQVVFFTLFFLHRFDFTKLIHKLSSNVLVMKFKRNYPHPKNILCSF